MSIPSWYQNLWSSHYWHPHGTKNRHHQTDTRFVLPLKVLVTKNHKWSTMFHEIKWCTFDQSRAWGEPVVHYRWTSWSWRLQENELPIILEESTEEYTSNEWKQNQKMSTCNRLDLESLGSWPTMPKNFLGTRPIHLCVHQIKVCLIFHCLFLT